MNRDFGEYGVWMIRYGVGVAFCVLGVAVLVVSPGGFGVEGFGLLAGAGSSILLLNFLYRLGVTGDQEREREEEARRYLARHGRWPDEAANRHLAEHGRWPEEADPSAPAADRDHRDAHREHGDGTRPSDRDVHGRRAGAHIDRSRRRRRGAG